MSKKKVVVEVSELKDSGSLWAKAFIRVVKDNNMTIKDIDEDLMLGWFCNAIECSHDYRVARTIAAQS